jgi:hypothetical protein
MYRNNKAILILSFYCSLSKFNNSVVLLLSPFTQHHVLSKFVWDQKVERRERAERYRLGGEEGKGTGRGRASSG